jgi:YegS/Rv2252/BmrU family lipid kinase
MLLIANPLAGNMRIRRCLFDLVRLFTAQGDALCVHLTRSPGDGRRVARARARDFDLIICAGGDGTLSECVGGVLESGAHPTLAYLPLGTTNDLGVSLGLPRSPLKAAALALAGTPAPYDVGLLNHRSFAYVAAFGAFTESSYATPQPIKNTLGRAAYLLYALGSLTEIFPYHMRITGDAGALEGDFLFGAVANALSIGGMHCFSRDTVRLEDGLLEVLLIRAPVSVFRLQAIVSDLMQQRFDAEEIVFFQSSFLTVEAEAPVPWTLDGEDGGLVEDATIHVQKHGVMLVRP